MSRPLAGDEASDVSLGCFCNAKQDIAQEFGMVGTPGARCDTLDCI